MQRAEKEEVVATLRSELEQAKSVILASHSGMDVNTINELRSKFRADGVQYRVVKNTLMKLAIRDSDFEVLSDLFTGPTTIAYSFEDAITPAKIIKEFAKTNKKFEVRAAYLDGQVLDQAGVDKLAEMPTKDELRAKFLMLLQGVPTKFVRTLNAGPQQFVMLLTARKQQQEEAA
ncbi:MAG: 50S ribosomal protein L10 [Bradymonadaceae bacterium]